MRPVSRRPSSQGGANIVADDPIDLGRVWNQAPEPMEEMDHTRVAAMNWRHTGALDPCRVGGPFIAHWIEFGRVDDGRRQSIHRGRTERRDLRVGSGNYCKRVTAIVR
jgi:hypothetical protein